MSIASITRPHLQQTAWICGAVQPSNRSCPCTIPTDRMSPSRRSCSRLRYTVAKLKSGYTGLSCAYTHSAFGCVCVSRKHANMLSRFLLYRIALPPLTIMIIIINNTIPHFIDLSTKKRKIPENCAFFEERLAFSADFGYK